MAKQTINQGTSPRGYGGDNFRIGSAKLQANDNELYAFLGAGADGVLNPAAARAALGLGNVNNTSDANKPISTPVRDALAAKADLVDGKVPAAQLPAPSGGSTTKNIMVMPPAGTRIVSSEYGGIANITSIANTIRLTPVSFSKNFRISTIGFYLASASAAKVRIGIYKSNPSTGQPDGIPVFESKEITTSAAGIYEIPCDFTFNSKEVYWIYLWAASNTTVQSVTSAVAIPICVVSSTRYHTLKRSLTYSSVDTAGVFDNVSINDADTGNPIIFFFTPVSMG